MITARPFRGQTGAGIFKYQIGVFEGRDNGSNTSDNLLYVARLTYNFWELEPSYYNSSTYYGAKDILAIGAVLMVQEDGAGTAAAQGDFTGWKYRRPDGKAAQWRRRSDVRRGLLSL